MPIQPCNQSLSSVESNQEIDDVAGFDSYDDRLEEEMITQLLATRACHLPHNSMCQDLIQFMQNNHPLFGILCHHRLHPVRVGQRFINLIGSIAFGLTATNVVFLMHIYYEKSMHEVLFRISFQGDSSISTGDIKQFEVTYGAVTLWTLGGMLHSVFDLSLWHLSACPCFLAGGICGSQKRLHSFGSYCVISLVAVLVAFATSLVVLRSTYEARLRSALEEDPDGEATWEDLYSLQSYNFVLGYLIELILVYCVHYPLVATLFFSGILGCGCLPFLGGRPAEVRQELKDQIRQNKSADDSILCVEKSNKLRHESKSQVKQKASTDEDNSCGRSSGKHQHKSKNIDDCGV